MKNILLGLGFAVAVMGTTGAYAQDAAPAAKSDELRIAGVRVGNPIDPSTWWDAHENDTGAPIAINPLDPELYMNMINPKAHSKMHGGITNPATWAQFLKVDTYANMMDLAVWGKWIEAKTYAPLADAETYTYWMQPGAFTHQFNLDHYKNMIKPENYGEFINATVSNFGYEFKTPSDLFSATEWSNSITAKGDVAKEG